MLACSTRRLAVGSRSIATACAASHARGGKRAGTEAARLALEAFNAQTGSDSFRPVLAYVTVNAHNDAEVFAAVRETLGLANDHDERGTALLGAISSAGTVVNGRETRDGRCVSVFLLGPSCEQEAHDMCARAFFSPTAKGLPEMLNGPASLSWAQLARDEARAITMQTAAAATATNQPLSASLAGEQQEQVQHRKHAAADKAEEPAPPFPVLLVHAPGSQDDMPSSLSALEALLPRSPKLGCTLPGSRTALLVNGRMERQGLAGVVLGGGHALLDLVPFAGATPVGPAMCVTSVQHQQLSDDRVSHASWSATPHEDVVPRPRNKAIITQLDGRPVKEALRDAVAAAGGSSTVCLGIEPQGLGASAAEAIRVGQSRTRRSRQRRKSKSSSSPLESSSWWPAGSGSGGGGADVVTTGMEDGEVSWAVQQQREEEAEEGEDGDSSLLDAQLEGNGHWYGGMFDLPPTAAGVGAAFLPPPQDQQQHSPGAFEGPLLSPLLSGGGVMSPGPRLLTAQCLRPQATTFRDIERVGVQLDDEVLRQELAHFQNPRGLAAHAATAVASSSEFLNDEDADSDGDDSLGTVGGGGVGSDARAVRPREGSVMGDSVSVGQQQCVLEVNAPPSLVAVGSRVRLCTREAGAAARDREAALSLYVGARAAMETTAPLPLLLEEETRGCGSRGHTTARPGRGRVQARGGSEGVLLTVSASRGPTFFRGHETDAEAVERRLGALPMAGTIGLEQLTPTAGRKLPQDGFTSAQSMYVAVCGVFRSRH